MITAAEAVELTNTSVINLNRILSLVENVVVATAEAGRRECDTLSISELRSNPVNVYSNVAANAVQKAIVEKLRENGYNAAWNKSNPVEEHRTYEDDRPVESFVTYRIEIYW